MAKKLGYFAKLYIGATAGTAVTMDEANELKLVTNANINGNVELVDDTDRSTKGYKSSLAGLKDFQIEGTAFWDNAKEILNIMREAFIQHKAIAVRASDGNGGGIDGDFVISNWTETQQNNQPIGYNFTLAINADLRVPILYAPLASGTAGTAIDNVEF